MESGIAFVLAHPNGWETSQQAELTTALRRALAVPSLEDRVLFVTEAEASVHYALQNSGNQDWLKVSSFHVQLSCKRVLSVLFQSTDWNAIRRCRRWRFDG